MSRRKEASKPGAHPPPSPGFVEQRLALRRIPRAWTWHRFHHRGAHALHFGTSGDNRFDDALAEYGVLYAARTLEGAFGEIFLRDLGPYRVITRATVERRALSVVGASRGLKLVDLAGIGLARMGLDSRLTSGSYAIAKRWSRAFHDHPDAPDGILYRSRHQPRAPCAAIFSRAAPALSARTLGTLIDHLGEEGYYALLERYRLGEL